MNKAVPIWLVTLVLGIGIGSVASVVGMQRFGYHWTPQEEVSQGDSVVPPPLDQPMDGLSGGESGERGGEGGRRGGRGGRGNFDPVAFFNERDEDGDGKLSGEEISDRMREGLAETDKDGDGSVSLEEFQERIQSFSGRGGRGREGDSVRPQRPPADDS